MPSPKSKGRNSAPKPKEKDAPKKERKVVDWEAVESHYRAGILSLRIIATQSGITEGAIRKRAKAEGWERALADKVRKAAKEELVRSDGTQNGTQPRTTDAETVKNAAQVLVAVARDHRSIIRNGRTTALNLLAELGEVGEHREEIEKAIDAETKGDKDSKRRAMMLKAVSLPSRAGVILNLSAAVKNFIALERQAFNMDDAPPPADADPAAAINAAMSAQEAASAYAALVRGNG